MEKKRELFHMMHQKEARNLRQKTLHEYMLRK